MPTCPTCGKENPEGFTFCGFCSSSLESQVTSDVRKTITALFCDLVGSTALGEEHDPEVLRPVLARYFDEMRTTIERHGGRVEKFIGDAIAAVFGLPIAHEDDALRAARAAIEMQERLLLLNEGSPIPLVARIGITTGEVLVPADDKPIVGDSMNTAARLETAAAPGEVLIGEPTYRLIRDAVAAEQVEPLKLKGKAWPITAYRLVGVASLSPIRTRRLDAPMVGRSRETLLLQQAFERAVSDRSCQLFTVLGSAGAGKSRLVEEFLGTLGVEMLQGRCLPYGDGITYYPFVEAIKGVLGLADFDDESTVQEQIHTAVEADEHADAITANLAKLLGAGEGGSPEETFWAIRRFLEIRGRGQPLVVVFDDIHWGEETFLDLIEHVADWSRDAQILLLCMARPDLLDERPAWAGGKTNATTISLAPLTEEETTELIDHLLGEAGLLTEVRARIVSVAEGNPLFVEEMLRMLIDDGLLSREGEGWVPSGDVSDVSIPSTIAALLSARLDRLSDPERQVIERAAVEGKEFHRGAVVELLPELAKAAADQNLKTLTRKELISPERSLLPGEDAYRFRHLLIRDAAYDRIPKQGRADMHVAFADWLERVAGDRVTEQEEIVGYHLEQAVRYRDELGLSRDDALRLRAGERLGAAGTRALDRGDMRASADLLERAADLMAGDPSELPLLDRLNQALGDAALLNESMEAAKRLRDAARAAGDEVFEARGDYRIFVAQTTLDPASWSLQEDRAICERVLRVYREHGAERFLPDGLLAFASVAWSEGHMAAMLEGVAEALQLARGLGDRRGIARCVRFSIVGLDLGPAPLPDAERRASGFLETFVADQVIVATALLERAYVRALLGRSSEARADADAGTAISEELGLHINDSVDAWVEGLIAWFDERPVAAEPALAKANRALEDVGDRVNAGLLGSPLARVLLELHRDDEATAVVDRFRDNRVVLGDQMSAFGIDAMIAARRGRFDEAERLLIEAEVIAEPTDLLSDKAQLALDRAEVMRLAGQLDEARTSAEDALAKYEQKEHVVGARRARGFLDAL